MYKDFYGFSEEPFRLTPDARFCFQHRSFAKARAYFQYALEHGEGFVLVTGRPGTGKTMLIDDLLAELAESRLLTVRIDGAQMQPDDLVRRIAYGFGLDPTGLDKATILHRLELQLDSRTQEGERALLIVDEAQILSAEALEELRLLTNLRPYGRSLIQIFLVGQDGLRDLIRSPKLEQLHQRVLCACHLEPLPLGDTRDYIAYRLERAGWAGDPVIDAAAVHAIHRGSQGVPRLINKFMDRLLLYAGLERLHHLGAMDVDVVLRELSHELLLGDIDHGRLSEQPTTIMSFGITDIDKPSGERASPEQHRNGGSDALTSEMVDILSPASDSSVDGRGVASKPSLTGESSANPEPIFSEPGLSDRPAVDPRSRLQGKVRSAVEPVDTGSEPTLFLFDAPPAAEANSGRAGSHQKSSVGHSDQRKPPRVNPEEEGDAIRSLGMPSRRIGWIPGLTVSGLLLALTLGIVLFSVGGPESSFSDRFALLRDWFGNRFDFVGNEGSPVPIDAINSGDKGILPDRPTDADSGLRKDVNPVAESGFADLAGSEPEASVEISDLVDDYPPLSTLEDVALMPQPLDSGDHETMKTESVLAGDSGSPRFDESENGISDPIAVPGGGNDSRHGDDFGNLDDRGFSGEASSSIDPKPEVLDSFDDGVRQRAPERTSGTDDQYLRGLPTSLKEEITDLGLTPIDADGGVLLNLRELIPFGFDSSEIPSDSIPLLDRLADILDRYQQVRIQVIGHTDDIGNADYNRQLSLSRATALLQYIAKRVQAPERFEAIGMGEDDPLISPGLSPMTTEQRLLNRRIEMRILPIQ